MILDKKVTFSITTCKRLSHFERMLPSFVQCFEDMSVIDEVLLVIDATTGQNGMTQARVFSEAVDVTGIVLTKLDGTAKGGIVVAIQKSLGVPVKLIGLGEGPDDLAPFEAEGFVDALLD
jgi:fused signal recognition particle receptor